MNFKILIFVNKIDKILQSKYYKSNKQRYDLKNAKYNLTFNCYFIVHLQHLRSIS